MFCADQERAVLDSVGLKGEIREYRSVELVTRVIKVVQEQHI